jgi:hypothetical protein
MHFRISSIPSPVFAEHSRYFYGSNFARLFFSLGTALCDFPVPSHRLGSSASGALQLQRFAFLVGGSLF